MLSFYFPVKTNVTFSCLLTLSWLCTTSVTLYAADYNANNTKNVWSFHNTVTIAQKNDPWLIGNKHQQQAIESLSEAAASMPDPTLSLGLVNLPTDSFEFSQENMTQLKVGISQVFPRGDSLAIKKQQLRIQSEAYPFQRTDREAKVAVIVGSLWLDVYNLQQSIHLIEKNRTLFEQLIDLTQTSYASTVGKTRQYDIIQAQLELTQLDDRLDKLTQHKNAYVGMLSQWLPRAFLTDATQENISTINQLHNITLAKELPQLDLIYKDILRSSLNLDNVNSISKKSDITIKSITKYFYHHPAIRALDKKITATKTGINLAEQAYRPEWGVNANYGYRDDDPLGNSRTDLFSIGVTFDLPLFTKNRQALTVKSAVSVTEAVKTEKILLLQQLLGSFSSANGRLSRLKQRKVLYQTRLLPQVNNQVEASLTAYTNDEGDFSDVVRSRIALLNAEIDQLNLFVNEQKIILELNYLFAGHSGTTRNRQQTFAKREEK